MTLQRDGRVDRRWTLLVVPLAGACAEPDLGIPAPTEYEQAPAPSQRMDPVAACDQALDGTPCGERGAGTHCLFDACVKNACGDGIKAGPEECDDGDEVDGNGCSARCKVEQCGNGFVDVGEECDDGNSDTQDFCHGCRKQVPSDAGTAQMEAPRASCPTQGKLEAVPASAPYGESISFKGATSPGYDYAWSVTPDMSTVPLIESTFTATTAKVTCGPNTSPTGVHLLGALIVKRLITKAGCSPVVEEITATCVDGDAGMDAGSATGDAGVEMDSGTLPMEAGAQAEASAPEAGPDAAPVNYPDCLACLRAGCADHNTLQLAGVCFDNLADGQNGPIPQPNATQRCSDAVQCSITATTGCAGRVEGPARCYCGEQTLAQCQTSGPLANAPCVRQWERVTECDTVSDAAQKNTCVLRDFQALSIAAGYAFFTIECANANCSAACGLPAQ